MSAKRHPKTGRQERGAARASASEVGPAAAIIDSAFRRAYRVSAHGSSPLDRSRRRALLKIVRSAGVVQRRLRLVERPFSRAELSPFDTELVQQRFGRGTLARARTRLRHAEERIRGLSRDAERTLARASSTDEFAEIVRRFYGRMASHLREIDADLETLLKIARFLDVRPHVDPDSPTVVVAGFPNVGKSSLVGQLTSARPKVADYPFTTIQVGVGHAEDGPIRFQVVDTPGVLGRRGRRNPAEAEAESAVRTAAQIVVFLLDPSGTSGYGIAEQEELLARWHTEHPDLPIIEVETKADLVQTSSGRTRVSAQTGAGIPELRRELVALIRSLALETPPEIREASGPE